jgi:hypothetical protein
VIPGERVTLFFLGSREDCIGKSAEGWLMRILYEWWAGLPWWLRLGVAVGCLLVSTVLLLFGRFWPWGWAVGLVLLLLGFPNKSERRGYHDF